MVQGRHGKDALALAFFSHTQNLWYEWDAVNWYDAELVLFCRSMSGLRLVKKRANGKPPAVAPSIKVEKNAVAAANIAWQ